MWQCSFVYFFTFLVPSSSSLADSHLDEMDHGKEWEIKFFYLFLVFNFPLIMWSSMCWIDLLLLWKCIVENYSSNFASKIHQMVLMLTLKEEYTLKAFQALCTPSSLLLGSSRKSFKMQKWHDAFINRSPSIISIAQNQTI